MAKWSVTKRIEFDAAHRLSDYDGKCANLHGHRYAVEFTYSSTELDDIGFVIDFGYIKRTVGEWLDSEWDHKSILKEGSFGIMGQDFIVVDEVALMKQNPTAENMAAHLYGIAYQYLVDAELTGRVELDKVRVYETPTSWAEFSR